MRLSLRPHHLLDILCDYGHGIQYRLHPYGHALHTVAVEALSDLDLAVTFVIGADAICQPCRHLLPGGQTFPLCWIIWHVLEHEIRHRGELSLIHGLLGREGLDV